ncbi:uncharacterized protein LOC133723208 [Rosa rugosa]|uniref:uncharacterized protein LOC133723208 n=1 Tax=Rosa rugosa TaxID=74645 RepID=UPI002B40F942|nr:uncharacterized protein LOC133723208 [Rosa rugosa]
MENPMSYTFITDKQKGLGIAIADLMSGAEHRHCVRHLYNNFKCKNPGKGLKQTLWNAARFTTHIWFNRNMEAMEKQSDGVGKWFEDKPSEQWSSSHFRTTSKCDILLKNLCELWNASLVRHRDKLILTMMEGMRMDSMTRMANKRVAGTRRTNMVGPRIAKVIEKIGKRTHEYRAHMSGEFLYQVIGGMYGNKHAVDLGMHTCTCRRWQLSGIPCVHATCAIFAKKLEPSLFVDNYLLPSTYLDAYNPIIYPIAGDDDWELVDYPIAPPPYKKQAGRPKMKRIKEPGEGKASPAPDASKMSRNLYGTKMTYKRGCPTIKNESQRGEGSSKGNKTPKKQQICPFETDGLCVLLHLWFGGL